MNYEEQLYFMPKYNKISCIIKHFVQTERNGPLVEFICTYLRSQVSVYRTIGPLVKINMLLIFTTPYEDLSKNDITPFLNQ